MLHLLQCTRVADVGMSRRTCCLGQMFINCTVAPTISLVTCSEVVCCTGYVVSLHVSLVNVVSFVVDKQMLPLNCRMDTLEILYQKPTSTFWVPQSVSSIDPVVSATT